MSGQRRRRITAVNSSPDFLELIDVLLEDEGPYLVTTRRLADTSVADLAATEPELVIIDAIGEDERAGYLMRDLLAAGGMEVPMVITTPASPRLIPALEGVSRDPRVTLLPKPFTGPALETVVERLLPSPGD